MYHGLGTQLKVVQFVSLSTNQCRHVCLVFFPLMNKNRHIDLFLKTEKHINILPQNIEANPYSMFSQTLVQTTTTKSIYGLTIINCSTRSRNLPCKNQMVVQQAYSSQFHQHIFSALCRQPWHYYISVDIRTTVLWPA